MSFDLGRIDITYVDKAGLLVGKGGNPGPERRRQLAKQVSFCRVVVHCTHMGDGGTSAVYLLDFLFS